VVDVASRSEETIAAPDYSGPIFDADTHVIETADAFTRYFPEDLKADWGIEAKYGPDGQFAYYVGPRKVEISADHLDPEGKVPAPGKLHEWLKAIKEGKPDIDLKVHTTPDMTGAAGRVGKLDEWGVRSSLIYVGNMVALLSYLDQEDPAYRIMRAYNRWMLDDWKFDYDGRIYSAPVMSLQNVERACTEVKWAIANGAKAILMQMGPINGKAPAHPDHDPFWAIVNEAGLRVVYHVGEAIYLKDHMAVWGEPMQQSRMKQTAFVWMHGYSERPVIETISSFIFWNFFERFPNIKILSAENGAEWVPSMLVKMDKCRGIAKNGFWPGGQLKERPSAIFKRHIGVVAYPEDDLKSIIDETGSADWLMMGSDYPHAEGTQTPRHFVHEACGQLTQEQTRKVMYENGMRFMGLEP